MTNYNWNSGHFNIYNTLERNTTTKTEGQREPLHKIWDIRCSWKRLYFLLQKRPNWQISMNSKMPVSSTNVNCSFRDMDDNDIALHICTSFIPVTWMIMTLLYIYVQVLSQWHVTEWIEENEVSTHTQKRKSAKPFIYIYISWFSFPQNQHGSCKSNNSVTHSFFSLFLSMQNFDNEHRLLKLLRGLLVQLKDNWALRVFRANEMKFLSHYYNVQIWYTNTICVYRFACSFITFPVPHLNAMV